MRCKVDVDAWNVVTWQKRRLPDKTEEFANSIRAGLTLEELTKEVEKAVMEESGTTLTDARNRWVGLLTRARRCFCISQRLQLWHDISLVLLGPLILPWLRCHRSTTMDHGQLLSLVKHCGGGSPKCPWTFQPAPSRAIMMLAIWLIFLNVISTISLRSARR